MNTATNTAYIFCGGLGTRMGPLGRDIPKPLFPLMDKTILWFQIQWFYLHGIRKIFINIHHKKEMFYLYFQQNQFYSDLIVEIIEEEHLLMTGGTLCSFFHRYPEVKNIWIANGDQINFHLFKNLEKTFTVTDTEKNTQENTTNLLNMSQLSSNCLFLMPIFPHESYNRVLYNQNYRYLGLDSPQDHSHQEESYTFSGTALLSSSIFKIFFLKENLKTTEDFHVPRSLFRDIFSKIQTEDVIEVSLLKGHDCWDFGTYQKWINLHRLLYQCYLDKKWGGWSIFINHFPDLSLFFERQKDPQRVLDFSLYGWKIQSD